jgi:predicted nucleic acid-binding protein
LIVLDTNVISEFDKPCPDRNAVNWLRRQNTLDLFLCAPVVMELSFGAERLHLRGGSDRLLQTVDRLLSKRFVDRVLIYDGIAALRTGRIRAVREKMGRPIDVQDAMIAATCLVHDATLATRNIRDFDGLDLKVINPFEATA